MGAGVRAARERRLTEHESQHRIDEIRQARGEENRADASGAPVRRGREISTDAACMRWNYPRLGPAEGCLLD